MKKNRFPPLVIVALLGASCSPSDTEPFYKTAETLREAGETLREAVTEGSDRMDRDRQTLADSFYELQKTLGIDEALPIIECSELKRFLPSAIPDYVTGETTGEKLVTMGLASSNAEVTFSALQGDGSLILTITDTGSMRGLATLAGKAMKASGYARETDTGYERTFMFRDYEGFERFNSSTRTGSKSILVANSFHIQVSGYDVPEKDLTRILDAIDYDALIRLKHPPSQDVSQEDASPDST